MLYRLPSAPQPRRSPLSGRGTRWAQPLLGAATTPLMSVEICLTTTPAATTTVPFVPVSGRGLMKFNRLRVVPLPPLSRQLTTSTIGYRTGSTPASFEPRTSASEVPPCEPQVGPTSAGEFAIPGAVETSVGTISASLPPTWNWAAVEFTHSARAGARKDSGIAP